MIDCFFESGKKVQLRHVTVDAIALNTDQTQVLLIKRSPQMVQPNKYALPGGFLDRDETLAQGVLRELQEETGYTGQILTPFCIVDTPQRNDENRQNINFVFLIKVDRQTSQPDPHEISSVHWFPLKKLPPASQFAFDHHRLLSLYLQHRKKPFSPLPFFVSS